MIVDGPFLRQVTSLLLLQCVMKPSQENEFINLICSENVAPTSGENLIAQCLSRGCF